jgi:hypothetical protein
VFSFPISKKHENNLANYRINSNKKPVFDYLRTNSISTSIRIKATTD